MKRVAAAVVAIALMLGVPATSASADTPDCVSKKEFTKIKRGWSKKRVHFVFDVPGTQDSYYTIGGDRYEGRKYRSCLASKYNYSVVYVDYENGKVESKSAYW